MKKVKPSSSRRFVRLGVELVDEGAPDYGVEMSSGDVSLCLFQTNDKPAPLHLAFVAKTR